MGIIKAALQAEDEQFISLHELLESLQKTDNCTLEEAAQILCRKITSAKENAPPAFIFHSRASEMRVTGSKTPLELLKFVAINGDYMVDENDIPF